MDNRSVPLSINININGLVIIVGATSTFKALRRGVICNANNIVIDMMSGSRRPFKICMIHVMMSRRGIVCLSHHLIAKTYGLVK